MIRGYLHGGLLALLAMGLVACGSQPRRGLANLPGADACFWTRNLSDWTVLNDSTLIVHAPLTRDAYLIKLFAPIPGLQFHERLGFEGGDGDPGQICSTNAYVIAGGPVPEREPVAAVRKLTPAQAKNLLSTSGASVPHRQPSPVQQAPTS